MGELHSYVRLTAKYFSTSTFELDEHALVC